MACVNIDWLEVYCKEPSICNASYFRSKGYQVEVRAYGTPQYKEMFSICDEQKRPILEIRRNPYSLKSCGGIFDEDNCHIRLANRTCYAPNPIKYLREFLLRHGYLYKCISRIDICNDFIAFQDGLDPYTFLQSYIKGEYLKINQSRVSSYGKTEVKQEADISIHGKDTFRENKAWNSVKWGSEKSSISTKLYNKSMEMKQKKKKFYILDAWDKANIDWANNEVWRIEFSLSSAIKGYVRLDDGELWMSTLSQYDEPDKLLNIWKLLAKRYFHFKVASTNTRKDRMKDLSLFNFQDTENIKPIRLTEKEDFTRTEKLLLSYIRKLYKSTQLTKNEEQSLLGTLEIIERIRKNKFTGLQDLFNLH